MFTSFINLILLTYVAANVVDIKDCPPLTPRAPPTNVNDLRIDDIKVIGALGDSISAGFGIYGVNTSSSAASIMEQANKEYRGLSFSIGGDQGAFSIANYIKHFQPILKGSSIGQRLAQLCIGNQCSTKHVPDTDRLNAALSGASAMNLDYELDYLISNLKSRKDIDFKNDWKMINLQIGSNDLCKTCDDVYKDQVTPEKYHYYVESAIERIRTHIPKVVINLINAFDVSQIIPVFYTHLDYCFARIGATTTPCSCATTTENVQKMGRLLTEYNERLLDIYRKYQKIERDDFALIYQHCNIKTQHLTTDFFSTLDCFHPGVAGHQWISKTIWNQLFVPQAQKPTVFKFDKQETLYCPTNSDRIAIH